MSISISITVQEAFLIVLTIPRLDLHANVVIDAEDEEIRDGVEDSDTQKDLRIIERNLLRHLHHSQNDHQVGAASGQLCTGMRHLENLHLGAESIHDG